MACAISASIAWCVEPQTVYYSADDRLGHTRRRIRHGPTQALTFRQGGLVMRVLFDLVHPADALFFFHAIRALRNSGAEVRIASRRKDVLVELLDELGMDHMPLTAARNGIVGQALELARRDFALFRLARAWKPDVMAGFGGVAISHVGSLLGIRSVSFYDTEHATLQLRLTLPFISEWHVPRTWNGVTAAGRTFRFPGSKQFAYLHPHYFRPDPSIARNAGWDPDRENFLVRTVSWQANHDRGRKGIPSSQLRDIVMWLKRRGKVHISAEGKLPVDLEPMRFRGRISGFHHLLAHCRLYCGESITVASEASALGVPVLLQIDKEYAYVAEQEAAGLIRRFTPDDDAPTILREILGDDQREFGERARHFAASSADINQYIVDVLCSTGASAEGPCARPVTGGQLPVS
jgi:predicted glycosyltransferase